mmetsp:Transcript_31822/g.52447  ORF Transcript_31822/g.52447 Transcript_31822/m.52447 type:complete len:145 (-) Transcript_31822:110-544(-)
MSSIKSTTTRKLIDYTQRGKHMPQHEQATSMLPPFNSDRQTRSTESSNGVPPSVLHPSFSSLDTDDYLFDISEEEDEALEPVDFFLKIPSRVSRRSGHTTDLRERFPQRQTRSNSPKRHTHIIKSLLSSHPTSSRTLKSQRNLI